MWFTPRSDTAPTAQNGTYQYKCSLWIKPHLRRDQSVLLLIWVQSLLKSYSRTCKHSKTRFFQSLRALKLLLSPTLQALTGKQFRKNQFQQRTPVQTVLLTQTQVMRWTFKLSLLTSIRVKRKWLWLRLVIIIQQEWHLWPCLHVKSTIILTQWAKNLTQTQTGPQSLKTSSYTTTSSRIRSTTPSR